MRRIISLLMENEPGALSRVVGLFSQRGYNIESLTVAPTEDNTLSRLTLTTMGDDHKIEQITKHLNRLIDVVKLVDLTEGAHIERELMLVKVRATGAQRAEVKRCVDIFRGQIVDVTASVYTIQITGASEKLDIPSRVSIQICLIQRYLATVIAVMNLAQPLQRKSAGRW